MNGISNFANVLPPNVPRWFANLRKKCFYIQPILRKLKEEKRKVKDIDDLAKFDDLKPLGDKTPIKMLLITAIAAQMQKQIFLNVWPENDGQGRRPSLTNV